MRKLILQLAVSLDGFIEGPNGEYDWCFTDQDYGMTDFLARVDSMLLGRKSYELTQSMGEEAMAPFSKLTPYIVSTTLPGVKEGEILIKENAEEAVKELKNAQGKDIWLFGGASLTTSMFNAGLIDEIILAVHPVILGRGKPLFTNINNRTALILKNATTYNSGLVMLTYTLASATAQANH